MGRTQFNFDEANKKRDFSFISISAFCIELVEATGTASIHFAMDKFLRNVCLLLLMQSAVGADAVSVPCY